MALKRPFVDRSLSDRRSRRGSPCPLNDKTLLVVGLKEIIDPINVAVHQLMDRDKTYREKITYTVQLMRKGAGSRKGEENIT